jgi:hypothetical protein
MLLSAPFVFSQYQLEKIDKTYRYVNPEIVNNLQDYDTALSTANMTKFRFANKSTIIEFQSGLKVELFSAKKLVSNGVSVDMSKVLTSEPLNKGLYIFGLSANKKHLLQLFTKTKLK